MDILWIYYRYIMDILWIFRFVHICPISFKSVACCRNYMHPPRHSVADMALDAEALRRWTCTIRWGPRSCWSNLWQLPNFHGNHGKLVTSLDPETCLGAEFDVQPFALRILGALEMNSLRLSGGQTLGTRDIKFWIIRIRCCQIFSGGWAGSVHPQPQPRTCQGWLLRAMEVLGHGDRHGGWNRWEKDVETKMWYTKIRYLGYLTLHHITSHYVTLHHIASRHVTSHYIIYITCVHPSMRPSVHPSMHASIKHILIFIYTCPCKYR